MNDDDDDNKKIKIDKIPVIGDVTYYTDAKGVCAAIETEAKNIEKILNDIYNKEEEAKTTSESKEKEIEKLKIEMDDNMATTAGFVKNYNVLNGGVPINKKAYKQR